VDVSVCSFVYSLHANLCGQITETLVKLVTIERV